MIAELALVVALTSGPNVIKFVGMLAPAPQCEAVKRGRTIEGKAATLDGAIFDLAWRAREKGADTVQVQRIYVRKDGVNVAEGKGYRCEGGK